MIWIVQYDVCTYIIQVNFVANILISVSLEIDRSRQIKSTKQNQNYRKKGSVLYGNLTMVKKFICCMSGNRIEFHVTIFGLRNPLMV